MKEISIEEKAKAYDEAIKRAKELLEIGLKDTKDKRVVLSFFPELAESEDKKMIQYFKDLAPFDNAEELYEKYGFSHKDAIAWLEKKGEQKPAAWSEEDEKMIEAALQLAHEYGRHGLWCWLKSLRPQSTWSPSDAQMASIKQAVLNMKDSACYDSVLVHLYEDLKKLKD